MTPPQASFDLVVPTKNEELWLPHLLNVAKQSSGLNEVYVVDNDCTTQLADICSRYGAKLLCGTTPAKSRNKGAASSQSAIVIFCDADIVCPPSVFDFAARIIATSKADVVHFRLRPMTESSYVNLCYSIVHGYFRVLARFGRSQGLGNFVAARKSAFVALGGFDEAILVGEDADFFRRAAKRFVVRYDPARTVYVSARRFGLEHPIVFSIKCAMWAALRLVGAKFSILDYRWEKYSSDLANRDANWIERHSKLLYPTCPETNRRSPERIAAE